MGKSKMRWLHRRSKGDPEIPYESPVWLGDISNGEFYRPQSEKERKTRELILQRCDENARRHGMDRREFIASSMGMATTLSVLNLAAGCGNKDGMMDPGVLEKHMAGASGTPYGGGAGAKAAAVGGAGAPGMTRSSEAGRGGGGMGGPAGMGPGGAGSGPMGTGGMSAGMGGGSDGGFVATPDLCMNAEMADKLFKTEYFILDFQTHHTRSGMIGPVLDDCSDGIACTSPDTYVRKIFEMSDTTVAVLSGLPASIDEATNDLSAFSFTNEDMRSSRDRVNKAAKLSSSAAERMLAHCQISPKAKPEANAKMMAENKRNFDTRGWKCYPPTEGGWFLHEHDAFIKTAIELEEPLVCVHKGFPFTGWSRVHADPGPDIGVTAMRYPNVNFVIYHSAYDSAHTEGPYDPMADAQNGGTDRLWRVVQQNNLMNKNVYAEMGSAWCLSMRDPVVAQHYLGKALKFMGEDRVVWGSECVWFGSPQNQIEAMKAFRISTEFQDMYGYPDYTDSIKRKVFGLTGAGLYRVDPLACRYKVSLSEIAWRKQLLDDVWGPRRHALNNLPAIHTRRHYIELWRERIARGEIA